MGRQPFDFYVTPAWATAHLLQHVQPVGRVLEPCSGDGAIADVLRQYGLDVTTNDRHHAGADFADDATDPAYWQAQAGRFDWIIESAYSCAAAIVPQAYAAARTGVAMFLRLSWLEPCHDRAAWLAEHPPTDLLVLPRIPFHGRGTDNITTVWCVWSKHSQRQRIVVVPRVPVSRLCSTT